MSIKRYAMIAHYQGDPHPFQMVAMADDVDTLKRLIGLKLTDGFMIKGQGTLYQSARIVDLQIGSPIARYWHDPDSERCYWMECATSKAMIL